MQLPIFYNYLQLLYTEVNGILLHQWFPRPILPAKLPERSKKVFVHNFIVILDENLAEGVVILHNFPKEHK